MLNLHKVSLFFYQIMIKYAKNIKRANSFARFLGLFYLQWEIDKHGRNDTDDASVYGDKGSV